MYRSDRAYAVTPINATMMIPLKPYTLPSPTKKLNAIPEKDILRLSVKIFLVGALVWDYTDTVLQLAAQMRIGNGTQKVSRAIKELKQDYDWMCRSHIDAEHAQRICDLSLLFERINEMNLTKLNWGLNKEIRRDTELHDDYVMLLDAVQTALTVLDALKLYAAQRDAEIRKYHPYAPHSCLPDHFRKLGHLLPLFAGDHYDPDSESRRITARILLNEINIIELYDEKGKV